MAVTITNLRASGPVLVPLTTGGTVRLSPGQQSEPLPDVAVADNAKVDKLQRLGLIGVEAVAASAPPAAEPTRSRKRPDSSE